MWQLVGAIAIVLVVLAVVVVAVIAAEGNGIDLHGAEDLDGVLVQGDDRAVGADDGYGLHHGPQSKEA